MREDGGFSLVELAISVTVIGILIAAVIKGREVFLTSQMASTIAQVDKYKAALVNFDDLFGGLPGDFNAATTQLLGCSGNLTCENGNADGMILDPDDLSSDWGWHDTDIAKTACESVQFWKHLAAAGLIDDVDVSNGYVCGSSNLELLAWHDSHPAAALSGGFEFFSDNSSNDTDIGGHFFRLSRDAIHVATQGRDTRSILSPHDAYILDRKWDDGQALSGNIMVDYGKLTNDCHDGNDYLIQETGRVCTVFFSYKR